MKTVRQRIAIITAIPVFLLSALISTPAYADTGAPSTELLPQCSDTTLQNWDWGAALKTITGTPSYSDFDYKTTSYTVLHIAAPMGDGNTTNHNRYKVFATSGTDRLQFQVISGVPKINSVAGYIRTANIISEPQNVADYHGNWTGSYSSNAESASGGTTYSTALTIGVYSGTPYDSTSFDCQFVANNVDYSPSWAYKQFNSVVLHGSGTGSTCSTTDIGCWVNKTYTGFQNILASWWNDLVLGFNNLWVPDTSAVSADYTALSVTWTDHIGFLSYPISFLTTLYGAFTDTYTYCSQTSCPVSFGNLFDSNVTINFSEPYTVYPTIWSFMLGFIRLTTVITLLIAFRKKLIWWLTI